jgi:hypothetical protein
MGIIAARTKKRVEMAKNLKKFNDERSDAPAGERDRQGDPLHRAHFTRNTGLE